MKVAQITTTLKGGAGIAAIRLSEALDSVGVNSEIVSQRGSESKTNINSKVTTLFQSSLVQSTPSLVTKFSRTTIKDEQLEAFDLLHFHSIYNLIGVRRIALLAERKPIFITLHDQLLFTGGCHYSGSCVNFMSSCSHCPQVRKAFWSFVEKEKILVNNLLENPRIHFVSPSNWLAEMAEGILKHKKRIYVVKNPIPQMPIISKEEAQKNARIQSDKYVIGFVSVHLSNPLKGLYDLINALNVLPLEIKNQIHLVLVGKSRGDIGKLDISNSQIDTNLQSFKVNPYSLMDLLVVPSRQDNSPNVIGEALMSGVRVLGSNIGGIPELIMENGCSAVNTMSPRNFANEILKEMGNRYSRLELATKASEKFSYKKIGTEVKKLYEEVL